MAITFPRAFPLEGCFTDDTSFEPVYQQTQAITGGASVNAADLGPPMWQGEFSTTLLGRENLAIWQAWLHSLDGGIRLFKGRPPFWKWPQAYPQGFAGLTYSGSPFTGSGNVSVIGVNRDTVTINQLPNGFTLKPGDYFSIPGATRQHLHRIVEGGVAASNSVSLTIRPAIRPGISTGIAALFEAPYCEMALFGRPRITRHGNRGGSVSFVGLQVLI